MGFSAHQENQELYKIRELIKATKFSPHSGKDAHEAQS